MILTDKGTPYEPVKEFFDISATIVREYMDEMDYENSILMRFFRRIVDQYGKPFPSHGEPITWNRWSKEN